MRLASGRDLGHLTYCTNIHAGEPLAEVMAGLAKHLPAIKAAVAPDRPLGVGLRLGHQAAEGLRDPGSLAALKRFLADGGYYVFTLNGFPYGAFHGRAVKEDAYKPDWSEPARLAYTDHLADILSALLPAGQEGSVSTVPCTFKPWAEGRMDAITDNLIRHVAHLVAIAKQTGKTIELALEPEPYCHLETIDEAVEFFKARLFDRKGVARLAALTGLSPSAAESAMRRHVGVCYDVCHAAVEFEDPKASVAQLRASGIRIGKLQLSSALKVASLDKQSAQHLVAQPACAAGAATARATARTRIETAGEREIAGWRAICVGPTSGVDERRCTIRTRDIVCRNQAVGAMDVRPYRCHKPLQYNILMCGCLRP
jgi:sugar phosphate isomerase/epimerase